MTETKNGGIKLEWICRLLMTIDIGVILSGYFSWFQTKRQLVSPLIPRTTVFEIFSDVSDRDFKISMASALIFLVGLWLYSFKKKIPAVIAFSSTIAFLFLYKFLH